MTSNMEIKESLAQGRLIWDKRMAGDDRVWSASTRCKVCGDWWLYAVKDNLDFTCPKCTAI